MARKKRTKNFLYRLGIHVRAISRLPARTTFGYHVSRSILGKFRR